MGSCQWESTVGLTAGRMAGSSEAAVPPRAIGSVIDLSGQGLQKLGPTLPCPVDTLTLILDKNQIIKLEHLEKCKNLMQLSVANNRLVRMMGVAKLTQLRVLNLPHNSIGYVEGLRDLVYLEWLNLAGNNLKTIDQINSCTLLSHLDLSDNNLSQIGDLSKLVNLKTLLLHGNTITSLRAASACLPHSLTILSLAENEIRDLNEISFLACLRDLEQLSIMNNPCVMATPSIPGFDYRPYVVSWCLSLKVLDGYVVSQKESLKAEWLYSQGKGRSYRPGQHVPLVQYLASVCPLTSTVGLKTAEDAKLEKILNKQRFHQRQLLRQGREEENLSSSTPNRGLTLPSEFQNLSRGQQSSIENEFGIQLDSWLSSSEDHSHTRNVNSNSNHAVRSHHSDLYLEDIQTDEDKLNCSLLSSESTFMPVAPGLSPVSPKVGQWVSGINLDQEANNTVLKYVKTFDEGNLGKPEMGTHGITESAYSTSKTEWKNKDELFPQPNPGSSCNTFTPSVSKYPACSAVTMGHTQKNGNKTTAQPNCSKENCSGISVSTDEDSYWLLQRNKAATKLQACWRGFYARNYNPKAKNVRYEIRLSRMQEHILFLSTEVSKLQKEKNEERIQRLIQEEAIKVLWGQVQSLQQWQLSINQQLTSNWQSNVVVGSSLCPSHLSVHSSNCGSEAVNDIASCSEINQDNLSSDFPDSGFCSTLVDPAQVNESVCFGKISTEESGNSGQPEETAEQHNTADPVGPSSIPEGQEDRGEYIKPELTCKQDNSLIQTFLKSDDQLADVEETIATDPKKDSILNPADIPENPDSLSNIGFSEELTKTFSTFQNGIIRMPEMSQLQEEN